MGHPVIPQLHLVGVGVGWALYLESKYRFKYVVRVHGEERSSIDVDVDAMSEDNKYVSCRRR